MKKTALILSFVAFFAFGTAGIQTVVASNNAEIALNQDGNKKDDKKKKTKDSSCKDAKSSCCDTKAKKEACGDDKKAEKK
jgi:high-affinity Fe2+/Pb2+ permease